MQTSTYTARRAALTAYFDHTAAAAWRALTSNAPVGRIRATVRAGRDAMRTTLMGWLPADMRGHTLLDAGCGTGSLAIEAAGRGATVIAIDVAGNLLDVARRRAAETRLAGSIEFRVGDMLADAPGSVDHVVAMDSLIHYDADDMRSVVLDYAARAQKSVLFTCAPWTPLLALMHVVGRRMPRREDRAPAIVPVRIERLLGELDAALHSEGYRPAVTARVKSGFYHSQAIGLMR